MKFEAARSSYLDQLRIERGLSSNSISAYARDLAKFEEFLGNTRKDFEKLTPQDLTDFEVSLKSRGLALSSSNRTLSAVKGFYKYASLEFDVVNPTLEIVSAKIARKLPKALSVDEVTRLIESAKREGDPISLRDFAILELLYSSGARVSEIVGVNAADISISKTADGDVTVLKLRGKGSKERLVPLGKFAVSALEDYFTRTRPALAAKNAKSEAALFLNSRGKRLSRQSAWQIVLDAAVATGLEGRVSPHVFRHSYATHLLDGGADIRVVQELLGHSSVTTTQIYTLITIDKVRESYSTAHPRAK
ncbi:integrase/recombinase XerD [Candidatus Planktophila dulcis]|uniref:Tyrosine recombinase XerC n=1 Tax=Candidatus Planktophila dulcis TaxID=1884914 RepID=A0AAD0E5U4_9ACTN|nr:site-specific tyrosine recombinase [Candidatus Planktophila dulcis]ASY11990.1 integrase/recombinase XerD [Candidatus Planktophila dulcis]